MMNKNRSIINNQALEKQEKYDKTRYKSINKDRKSAIEYEIGDYVLIDVHRERVGNVKKFTPTWIGPFEIIKIMDKQFVVREIGNDTNVRKVNIRYIKPYKSSPYINLINLCLFMMNKSNLKIYKVALMYIRNKHEYHQE